MRVRLWTSWPAPDGTVHSPGDDVDLAAADAAAICQAGAGELLADDPEVATAPPAPERAVGRAQRRRKARA